MFNGSFTKLLTKPKPKIWDFKIQASLCIHRTVQSSVIDSLWKLMFWPNPKVVVSNRTGDAMIDRSRSIEASEFLKSDNDVMLFIDDDIQFKPEDAIKICKAANTLKGIVCGAYVIKKEQYTWITCKPLDDQPIIFKPDAELTEVRWAATGFLAIHRQVFQDLLDRSNEFHLHHPNHFPLLHPTDLKYHYFFKPMEWKHPNGDYLGLSEDWAFCEKARNIGYKVWLDPSIRLTHYGHYGFDLNDLCRPAKEYCEVIKYEDIKNKHFIPRQDGKQVELQV